MKHTFTLFLLIVLWGPPEAWAQETRIFGTMKDITEFPIVGASIVAEGQNRGTISDSEGNYALSLKPGEYTITASIIGYKTMKKAISVGESPYELHFMLVDDYLEMNEIVVSGSFNSASKLESSTAMTTLNARVIENRIQRGVGDLMKAIPGVAIMSEGGDVGANITVRGLPQGSGSFKYLSLREEGLPVFEVPDLYFAFIDGMYQLDESVQRMEAVRGGTAAIFASNNSGGIVNFISKSGGDKLAGITKVTYGTQGMYRTDINVGGPLGDKWKFNVGGFYRYDLGVRPTGSYPANQGGQIKANFTRQFNNGYLRLYGRYLNTRNLWYTGAPFQNYNQPQRVTGGPDLRSGSMYSSDYETLIFPDAFAKTTSGESVDNTTRHLSDGMYSRVGVLGLELFKKLGNDINLTLRAKTMRAANQGNVLVSDLREPIPINNLLQSIALAAGRGNPQVAAAIYPSLRTQYVTSGELLTPEQTAQLHGNGLAAFNLAVGIDRPVNNSIVDMQLNKAYGAHSLTAGFYGSVYNTTSRTNQNLLLTDLQVHPRLIQLGSPLGANGSFVPLFAKDGFLNYNVGYTNASHYGQVAALYAGDEWQANERLKLEGGLRLDLSWHQGRAERPVIPGQVTAVNGQPQAVGQSVPAGYSNFIPSAQDTRNGQWGSRIDRTWDYRFSVLNGSLGLNYKLSTEAALFARTSLSNRTPTLTQWESTVDNNNLATGNTVKGSVERIGQYEAGFKLSTSKVGLFTNLFYSRVNGMLQTLQVVKANGSIGFEQLPTASHTVGSEVEVVYSPVKSLQVKLITTWQDARWTDFRYVTNIPGNGQFSGEQVRDYRSNRVRDVASLLYDAMISYNRKGFDAFLNYRWVGPRAANQNNLASVQAYGEWLGGLSYTWKQVTLGVKSTNLLNTAAMQQVLTRLGEDVAGVNEKGEVQLINMDPNRVDAAGKAIGVGNTYSTLVTGGRGILPHNVLFSLTYQF